MTTSSSQVRRLTSRVTRTAARLVDYATRNNVPVAGLPAVKLPWYEIRSAADGGAAADAGEDAATVLLFDEIGGSFGVDASSFVEELDGITASTINLRINSPGGAVFDALAIANALRHHPARVVAYVDGLAASAASFIATAADEVVMMPGSQLMIHDASAMGDGNADDMGKLATFLDRQSDNIAALYQLKGGGDVAEWRNLMRAETWMFAHEAVGFGLADRIEQARDAVPGDVETEELLSRSFDLGGFRYAGRASAPDPRKTRRTGKAMTQQRSRGGGESMTLTTAPDLASAAKARSAALGGSSQQCRTALPTETGQARLVPAGAHLKARLTERNGQQVYCLEGVASVTDKRYRMWDAFGEYDEVVARGAFTETLAANPDVTFLINHKGMTLARTQAGTLELSMDGEGLHSRAWLNPKRQDVQDLVLAIEDRAITEMSFAFMLEDGEWSDDFTQFRITKLSLDRGDVSAVNYGANPYTSIAARSREILADLEHLPGGLARAAMDRLIARGDVPSTTGRPAATTVTVAGDGSVVITNATPQPEPDPAESTRDLTNTADISFYEHLFELT